MRLGNPVSARKLVKVVDNPPTGVVGETSHGRSDVHRLREVAEDRPRPPEAFAQRRRDADEVVPRARRQGLPIACRARPRPHRVLEDGCALPCLRSLARRLRREVVARPRGRRTEEPAEHQREDVWGVDGRGNRLQSTRAQVAVLRGYARCIVTRGRGPAVRGLPYSAGAGHKSDAVTGLRRVRQDATPSPLPSSAS